MSRKTSSSRSLAFVYGTLKQGFSNHWLMEDVMTKGHARFVGIASTKKRYPLVCGPFQVPFLLDMPACGCHVRGELYEVDRVAIDHLDELEGVSKGHYVRRPLALTGLQSLQFFNYDPSGEIQAEAYFAAAPLTQGLAASSAHIEAYTKKQTVNYVPRKDRPQNRTFLEHVNAWIESQSQSVQLEGPAHGNRNPSHQSEIVLLQLQGWPSTWIRSIEPKPGDTHHHQIFLDHAKQVAVF
ncbi:unnamed protein product [Sphagnum tenellum]